MNRLRLLVLLTAFAGLSGSFASQLDEEVRFRYTGFETEVRLEAFQMVYAFKQCHLICRVKNLNQYLPARLRVRVIEIDDSSPAAVNARLPNTLHIGSYWFQWDGGLNPASVFPNLLAAHEMGHLLFDALPPESRQEFERLFHAVEPEAFAEGRSFPGHPLGHPEDGPHELFASALAVYYGTGGTNRLSELDSRVGDFFRSYIEPLGIGDGEMCEMWQTR